MIVIKKRYFIKNGYFYGEEVEILNKKEDIEREIEIIEKGDFKKETISGRGHISWIERIYDYTNDIEWIIIY